MADIPLKPGEQIVCEYADVYGVTYYLIANATTKSVRGHYEGKDRSHLEWWQRIAATYRSRLNEGYSPGDLSLRFKSKDGKTSVEVEVIRNIYCPGYILVDGTLFELVGKEYHPVTGVEDEVKKLLVALNKRKK